jgi:hypothetical protein
VPNLYKNHISFNSGLDIHQICQPMLTAFKLSHFTYCKQFHDGSRAILTTSTESLYDLYQNKKYIFSNEYSVIKNYNTSDYLIDKHIGFYFQSDIFSALPAKFDDIKKIYLQQRQYEIQQQNITDRFHFIISHEKYKESFIFFISQLDYPKSPLINNLELFIHFRLYFLEKAQKLILLVSSKIQLLI